MLVYYSRAFIDFTCMPELSPRENTAGYEVDECLLQRNSCNLFTSKTCRACIIEPICLLLLNQNISIL